MSSRLLTYLLAVLLGLTASASAQSRRTKAETGTSGGGIRRVPRVIVSDEEPLTPAAPSVQQVTYPVADLVIPIPMEASSPFRPLPDEVDPVGVQPAPRAARWFGPKEAVPTIEEALIRLITSTVAQNSWAENGGPGKIQYYPVGMALVVNNTPQVQDEVSQLLEALRRLQDVSVMMEIRVIQVDPAHVEEVARDLSLNRTKDEALETEKAAAKTPRLVSAQGDTWRAPLDRQKTVRFLRAIQAHDTTTILQAPRVTLFNGQEGRLDVTDQMAFLSGLEIVDQDGRLQCLPRQKAYALGQRFGFRPTVSADRRTVRVDLQASLASLADAPALIPVQVPVQDPDGGVAQVFNGFLQRPSFTRVHVKPSCTIADGGSMVFNCGTVPVQVQRERSHPFLEGIPFLNHLFGESRTVQEERTVLIVVTPHVHVSEEVQEVPVAVTEQTSPAR